MSAPLRAGDRQSGRRRLAVMTAVLVMVAVGSAAAYGPVGIPAAAASTVWGNAEEVPGTAALNAGGSATIESISCASAGNCSAGGSYTDGSGDGQAFVVSEVNGTWGSATEVPGTAALNTGGSAAIRSVSCASAGNCSAGGDYSIPGANKTEVFVISEVNGAWGTAVEVPGIDALNQDQYASFSSVSCASAGNCGAGGFYTDGFGHWQPFVISETDGTWADAIQVPGIGTLNFGLGETGSVSCASAGNCSAGGFYNDSTFNDQAFVVDEVNGTWGTAEEVPGTAALNQGGGAELRSVSCASAGNCSAGGRYTDGSHGFQVFVIDEVNGTWGTAEEVPGTAALNTEGGADFGSVSCASAGNCSAGGVYYDSSFRTQVFVVDEVNGTWGTAEEVPGTAVLNTEGNAAIAAVSCASAGNCSAGGIYYDSSSHGHAFVVDEVNGTWETAEEVPGTPALDQGESADLTSLSCAPQDGCGAGGFYTDASGHIQAFVVSQTESQSSATALNLSAATATYGSEQAEQVSVTVSAAGTPTGTVTVTAGSSTLCTITLAAGAGSCTLQATQLPAGTYQVTGSYSGDANTSPSTSPAQNLTVSKAASATALNLSAATATYGSEQAEQVSVTVSAAGTPTGTVTVTAGSSTLCTITLAAGAGSCTLQATQLPAGTYQVTGSYSGDANTSPSSSPAQALTVQSAFTDAQGPNYAGWSVHPASGAVRSVQAQWQVPQITSCGTPFTRPWYRSRAAVWAGMWGPLSGISTSDWLPQAGTVSECVLGIPIYEAVYELAASKGGDPAVVLMTVSPGDTIQAAVTYRGTNSANQLLFTYSVTDVSQGKTKSGPMPPTPKGVPLSAATYQGGVIVESEPVASQKTCVRSICVNVPVGGLSKFGSPIFVSEPFTMVNGAALQTYSGANTVYRWDMISSTSSGEKLADTGPVTSSGFSVTWDNYN